MDTSSNFKVYAYDMSDSDSANQSYATKRKNDLKRIKKILKAYPNVEIKYYNGWISIAGETFNGFSKEFINKYCNIAINRV